MMTFLKNTCLLIALMLAFIFSVRFEYEFWLVGNRATNLASPEHWAMAFAIASNITKFAIWFALIKLKQQGSKAILLPITAIILVIHSVFCGLFSTAASFDRANLATVQTERREVSTQRYDLRVAQLRENLAVQNQLLLDKHNQARADVVNEFSADKKRWQDELERQRGIFKRGSTTDYWGEGFDKANTELNLILAKETARFEQLDEQFSKDSTALRERFEARLEQFTDDYASELAGTSEESLMEQNSIFLSAASILALTNVLDQAVGLKIKPAMIILISSVFINVLLELIVLVVLSLLYGGALTNGQLKAEEGENKLASQS